MLGVVCTQSYAQCIWSAASTPKARRGALLCALFMPIIGAACTLVGIYMRGHYITADEMQALKSAGETLPAGVGIIGDSAQAFPAFVLKHIVDNDDKEALPVFTSESELEKGGPTSRMTLPMEECMQLALDTDYLTGMVINPHGNCFIMDKETLKGFLDLIRSE